MLLSFFIEMTKKHPYLLLQYKIKLLDTRYLVSVVHYCASKLCIQTRFLQNFCIAVGILDGMD